MPIDQTGIAGLLVVRWDTHGDDRGFFRQTYQLDELSTALGRVPTFVQGNHSRSEPGVLRGFHAEPWDKLIYVVRGVARCVIADIRPASATFASVESFDLGDPPAGQRVRLFVAEGLANSFCTFGETATDYVYDVSSYWRDVEKPAVTWDDPDLGAEWPVEDPVLSDADRSNPTLRELFPDHPLLT